MINHKWGKNTIYFGAATTARRRTKAEKQLLRDMTRWEEVFSISR
jgi:hypothetical protein